MGLYGQQLGASCVGGAGQDGAREGGGRGVGGFVLEKVLTDTLSRALAARTGLSLFCESFSFSICVRPVFLGMDRRRRLESSSGAFAFNHFALGAGAAIGLWVLHDVWEERKKALNEKSCGGCGGTGYVDCFCTKWNFSAADANGEVSLFQRGDFFSSCKVERNLVEFVVTEGVEGWFWSTHLCIFCYSFVLLFYFRLYSVTKSDCGTCHGSLKEKCPKCNGRGRLVEKMAPALRRVHVNDHGHHPFRFSKASFPFQIPLFRQSKPPGHMQ